MMNGLKRSDPLIRRGSDGRRSGRRARHSLLALGLIGISTTLSGCATMVVQGALGAAPRSITPQVREYEWVGRRGDTIIVSYTVWDGETTAQWTAIDLRGGMLAPGLGAPPAGTVAARRGPVPESARAHPVPVIALPAVVPGYPPQTPPLHPPTDGADIAVYARPGRVPEIVVISRNTAGAIRSASWALDLGEPRPAREPVPRALARLVAVPVAGAVDLVTLPLQLLLGMLGVLEMH
jgi:hypothetical protein